MLCASRENLPQSIMLRKANDALFGVNITREFGLRALFCGKHSEAGWLD